MRKLVLSLCVIAASGAYVARTAMIRDGGVQDLLDRVSLHPPRTVPDLNIAAPEVVTLNDLLPVPPFGPVASAPDGVVVATAPSASAPGPAEPTPSPAPAPAPAPAPSTAVIPPLPRLAPTHQALALATPPSPPPDPAPTASVNVPPVVGTDRYRDGDYTGTLADAYFGLVQVRAHVSGGKLASVDVLKAPASRRTSIRINNYALPVLQREAVAAQAASVDIVSGATLTAVAYMRSLDAALHQAE